MPLIKCPECGRSVSDAAPECVGCGRAIAPAPRVSRSIPKPSPYDRNAGALPKCADCGSDAYRRLADIHKSSSSGIGPKTAPPKRRNAHPIILVCALVGAGLVVSGVVGPMTAGVILLAGCAWKYYEVIAFNRNDYPAFLAAWNASYVCERCGAIAVMEGAEGHLQPTVLKQIA